MSTENGDSGKGERPKVAVVLPGGGSRGAYEAGALSVLLPALEERGEEVSIYCGTSVGAINGTAIASHAHLGPSGQALKLLETWEGISKHEVTGRLIGPGMAIGLASLVGETLGIPGVRFRGLIEPKPLRRNLERWIDWEALRTNIDSGRIDAVCSIATGLRSGVSVGFLDWKHNDPPKGGAEEIVYTPVEMETVHVRASAAIPGVFPAVEIPGRGTASGWFVDGATRLNTPIRPAIDLGAERIIVISFEPYANSASRPKIGSRKPGLADVAANVLDGLLTDQVVADTQRLAAINSFFADGMERSSRAARAYRQARGRRPYRKIPYALVSPRSRRQLGKLAERIFRERYGGVRALRDLDTALMGQALGGGPSRGELLTFLFFDEEFVAALIDAGRRDARHWLSRHPNFWCSDASHDFHLKSLPADSEREVAVLEEWRTLRRR